MKKLLLAIGMMAMAAGWLHASPDTTKVSLLPSRFADNWFLQAGVTGHSVYNNGIGPLSPGAELYVGKWFIPSVGARIGATGWQNRPNGTQTGWFSGYKNFWYGHADLDVMWNVLNTFRYNEHRFWDLVPFVRGSAILTKQQTDDPVHVEAGGGVGLHNGLRLGRRVDLYIEAAVIAAREKAYRQRGSVAFFPSVSAGVVVRVGPTGFRRQEPETEYVYQPVYVDREVRVTDTVTVEKTIVDSLLIQQMKEEPLTLYFDLDKTELTQRELDHLERYAHYVLKPESVVLLVGSADKETGNSAHNQWLSEKRNEYVRDILMRVYGLKRENIREIANGDRINEFRTPEQNRCVTISFVE